MQTKTTLVKLFVLSMALLAVAACKKSSSSSSANKYFFHFKANGQFYDVTGDGTRSNASLSSGQLTYDGFNSTPFYPLTVGGFASNDYYPSLWVSIKSLSKINGPAVFVSNPSSGFRGVPGMEMQCSLPVKDVNIKAKTYNGYKTLTLTLSDITIDYVRGTFSGTLPDANDSTISIAITEGEFYLPRTD